VVILVNRIIKAVLARCPKNGLPPTSMVRKVRRIRERTLHFPLAFVMDEGVHLYLEIRAPECVRVPPSLHGSGGTSKVTLQLVIPDPPLHRVPKS